MGNGGLLFVPCKLGADGGLPDKGWRNGGKYEHTGSGRRYVEHAWNLVF